MDLKAQKEILNKINDVKNLEEESQKIVVDTNKSEVARLYGINNKLLEIAENELETKKVPSKETLDTIITALTITAALPWSKYNI